MHACLKYICACVYICVNIYVKHSSHYISCVCVCMHVFMYIYVKCPLFTVTFQKVKSEGLVDLR